MTAPTLMLPQQPYDAVVVGSGSTGGWAAKELSERGLRVLVLEAGDEVRTEALDGNRPPARRKRWLRRLVRRRQRVQSRHIAWNFVDPDLFVDDVDNPYSTPDGKPFVWIRGRQVGGRSLTWRGLCLRLSDYELRESGRDGYGEEWPFDYADIARYYDRVEAFMGVRGSREGLRQMPDGCFKDAAPLTPAERHFRDAVHRRWPERRVIPNRGLSPEDPGASYRGEDWPPLSSQGTTLPAALATRRVTLRSSAVVSHVLSDEDGSRARGVVFVDRNDGSSHEVRARCIVLCASTIESTRILLNSTASSHPDGLGNSSGQLGRHLMDHVSMALLGRLPGAPPSDRDYGFLGPQGILIPRFRNLEGATSGFLRGYGIWGGIQRGRIEALFPSVLRLLGPFDRSPVVLLLAQGEALSRPENRVVLDRERKDALGIPTVRIEYEWHDNERRMARDIEASMREMVEAAGGKVLIVGAPDPPGLYVHESGTARMGRDPKRSVLNGFQQSWDVPNLFVMDGAGWVSGGWQNPTLTMMALAVRSTEYLAAELERGRL